VVPDPAFGDAEFVGDLPHVQKTFVWMALLGGDLVRFVKVTPHALDREFDPRLRCGFNYRKIAGVMV
jgi:hypothetical protein